MAACSKSVNFPIRKLFESIPGLSPEDDEYNIIFDVSEDTKQLLSIMIDRMDEQLRACGANEVGNHQKQRTEGKYRSIVSSLNLRAGLQNSMREVFRFTLGDFNKEDARGLLFLFLRDKSFIELRFRMNTQTKAIRISEIKSRHLKRVLDFFDPRGTGYEFFTPDELERYAAMFPTPESRQGHNLMSPELRHYRTVPSMLSMLRGKFRANQYPDQTEAFKAYEQKLRRDEDDDRGGNNKRRRMEWAVGASGYEVQLGIL